MTRVAIYGFGTVGRAVAEALQHRADLELVGVVASEASRPPQTEAVGDAVLVATDAAEVLARTRPEVVLHATTSLVAEVAPQLEICLEAGASIITSSEEMAWPWIAAPRLAQSLHRHAERRGATVVGLGVNPGYVCDVLPTVLAAATTAISRIRCRRVLDCSVFGAAVHKSLGLGSREADFPRLVTDGVIRGHLGFPESAALLAGVLGTDVVALDQSLSGIWADRDYPLRGWTLRTGRCAGVLHRAKGVLADNTSLEFDLALHVNPSDVGWECVDEVEVVGEQTLTLTISPGTDAVRTTAARMVNAVHSLRSAPPGIVPATALPLASFIAEREKHGDSAVDDEKQTGGGEGP